jgi:hypothetical protein
MQLDSNEQQLKVIAAFTAELIQAIASRSPPKRKETWPEYMARAHDIDLNAIGEELAEGRRRARMATVPKK